MAVAAAQLALYFPEVNLHEAQLAAVLSDVGQLLLADHFGDVYADALDDADRTRRTIHEVERERFGVDHARLASRVLRFWKIPAALADAIEAHCDPQAIEALDQHARELAKVVHLTAISVAYLISNAAHGFETIRQLTERWIKLDAEGCSVLLGMLVDPIERLDQMYAAVPLDPTEILAAARKLIVKESLATATSLVITARQAEETQAQIEKLQRHRERLEQQVTTDPLTGIGNRKHFEDQLRKELKRCMRSRQPLSLIMFDLDQFKRLNDTFGHPAGDEVLRSTTRAIRECLRASDDLSRYGGEEFMVIAPETDLRGAESLADRMREKLESTTATYGPHVLCITASFGVATISGHEISVSPEQLIQAADNCMYAAKRAGRNCVRAVSM
jgi:diguanylate cyclase (GGDEF)-like protein